jgi:hypothetical protein
MNIVSKCGVLIADERLVLKQGNEAQKRFMRGFQQTRLHSLWCFGLPATWVDRSFE